MDTSIFQTEEWAQFKCKTGYADFHRIDDIIVLEKKLPLGRSMLYSPEVSEKLKVKSEKYLEEIKELAQKTKAIFYRLELDTPIDHDPHPNPLPDQNPGEGVMTSTLLIHNTCYVLRENGFRKAFEEMQPEHTLILDIAKSESEIMEQMKQKGRYNIKIAERSNLNVSWSAKPGKEIDHFYALYETMAKRQKISYRNKKYFEALLDILGQKGYARVYSATTGTDRQIPLATAIVTYCNNRATYLFGGSSSEMRNLMAPYLLHWQIIKDARGLACVEYDLFGIAPTDDEKHPWAGITRFKKQFGGQEVQLAGSWDLVFRPIEYQVFKIAEKIRR